MLPLQSFSSSVLVEVIRRQPPSLARTALAWQLAVGATLGRVTSVEQAGRTLVVRSTDPRWTVEIERAREVILRRLRQLLGPDSIAEIRLIS
ncbi:MAG TPA: DciA family protein [Vicinamibacterales bacterium]|nr:DciA family protein [Vicinamibacterales bacterium]